MTTSSDPVQEVEDVRVSTLKFPVIGIGASAGGLKAVERVLEHLPADSGMAFVIVLHLAPDHESVAADILQHKTKMSVLQVVERTEVRANHVYVVPPNKVLVMDDDHLDIADAKRQRGRHVVVDLFFRTLAEAHQARAIAVVLSGMGVDGTLGLSRIKEKGGVVLAQAPEDAEFDGMPKSAIASELVDFVLPAAEIGQKLIDLWNNIQRIRLPAITADGFDEQPDSAVSSKESESALREIVGILRAKTGHDFRRYKRATVLRRIERRLQVHGLADLPAYRDYLAANPKESIDLLKDLLISVTNFFRDREAFETLEREILPLIYQKRSAEEPVRAWVAGCATGEEAYSVAMLLNEQAELQAASQDFVIFATDIDESAIATGRAGLYPETIVADVTPTRLRQVFLKEQGRFRVKKSVREKVLFAQQNILRDPPFSRLDLISCRNLLIYLDRQVQQEVLQMFHFALRPGGYLFLGSSESADVVADLFTIIDKKHRIYAAKPVARAVRHVPTMPLGGLESLPIRSISAPERRPVIFTELHERLRQQYAPPSVLIDSEYSIVHVSDGANAFLRYVSGLPSHNLISVVRSEFKLELRSALFQMQQAGNSVEARRVKVEEGSSTYFVNMTVRPVREGGEQPDLILILFNRVEETTGGDTEAARDSDTQQIVQQLEKELVHSKEQVQNVLEQSEIANEEMKAANEELQAINEELRSATEELETSKEEAQSINEELITVNHELKAKVEETSKINDDLQNLIASTEIATIFIDRDMRIMRFTPPALILFSLIPTDVGRSLLDIRHRLDYSTLLEDAEDVFRTLRPMEREIAGPQEHRYVARILPYRTTDDRIDGAVMTFVDITSLRRAERDLRAGEARMRLIADCTKDYAIVTLDENGIIESWNTGAQTIFGFNESEIVGQHISVIFTEEDRTSGVPEDEMARARKSGRASDERWHRRRDGTRFFCSGVMTLLSESEDGAPQGFAKIARDMTDHKKREVEREESLAREQTAHAEAQAANRIKDEFLAIVSHELKHPLNLININAELLGRTEPIRENPLVKRATSAIQMAVTTQAQVIDDMLDLSRVNTGRLSLKRQLLRLDDVITSIFPIFEVDAVKQGVELLYKNVAKDVTINADPVRIEQIVWNLVSNAIKFTPRGGHIEVRVSAEKDVVELTVSDTGQGISPSTLKNVFELFQRGEARNQRQEDGLGVGLALVDQLTRLHGGRVAASSLGEGKGATFSVFLPLSTTAEVTDSKRSVRKKLLPGLKILVVDDTPDTLSVLGELLRIAEADVTEAGSGKAALVALRGSKFDLVLTDLGMPEMDGYGLIAQIRKLSQNQSTPVIALSGYGRKIDIQRTASAGFAAHIGKPVEFNTLIDTVRRVVELD